MAFGKAVRCQQAAPGSHGVSTARLRAVSHSPARAQPLAITPAAQRGLGITQSIPAVSPRFSRLMEEWRGTCLCTGHSGMCPLAAPHGHKGNVQEEQLQEPTCGHSATSPQATLHNSTLPIALKGLLEQAPTLSAFSDPSSVSRRNIQVEQAI